MSHQTGKPGSTFCKMPVVCLGSHTGTTLLPRTLNNATGSGTLVLCHSSCCLSVWFPTCCQFCLVQIRSRESKLQQPGVARWCFGRCTPVAREGRRTLEYQLSTREAGPRRLLVAVAVAAGVQSASQEVSAQVPPAPFST